jgi:POLQ-like helicase
LAQNIQQKITDPVQRRSFGRTLLGIDEILDVQKWVTENINQMRAEIDPERLLEIIWPLFSAQAQNRIVRQGEPKDAYLQAALSWIEGNPFFQLHSDLVSAKARLVSRSRRSEIKLEQVIDFCENGLGYDCTLLIGAIIEIISVTQSGDNSLLIAELQLLQKRIKYGLPNMLSVNFYELGFSDRVIALELSTLLAEVEPGKAAIRAAIVQRQKELEVILNLYPSYFKEVLDSLL